MTADSHGTVLVMVGGGSSGNAWLIDAASGALAGEVDAACRPVRRHLG